MTTGAWSDAALVVRAQGGDRSAFEALVLRHTRLAGAVATSVVSDPHAALDVVQEAFLKALRSLSNLEDPARFRGWLRHVVRTTALDWRRRQGVAGRTGERLPGEGDDEGSASDVLEGDEARPEDALADAEQRALVRAEVASLPESQREVVWLKYMDGLSYEAIADVTGLTVSTIESRLFRARATLRKRLAARFGSADPAEGRA